MKVTSGIDQLHMKMTCKRYRLKLYITKPQDMISYIVRSKLKGITEHIDGDYDFDFNLDINLEYNNDKVVIQLNSNYICYMCHKFGDYNRCDYCNKTYCNKCFETKDCQSCCKVQCENCKGYEDFVTCKGCNNSICNSCLQDDYYSECFNCNTYQCCNIKCYECDKVLCNDCSEDHIHY